MNDKTEQCEVTEREPSPSFWERTYADMIEGGITFGVKYTIEWLEQRLACSLTEQPIKFGTCISNINDELSSVGLYLSQRDQRGEGYVVLNADQAEGVANSRVVDSFRQMQRACRLFGGIARNPDAQISDATRQRLLKREEKAAIRLALMRRPLSYSKILQIEA